MCVAYEAPYADDDEDDQDALLEWHISRAPRSPGTRA